MRVNGTGGGSGDTSSSSFMVIGDGGGGGGGGTDEDGDDDRGYRRHFARTLDSKLKKLQRHHGGGGGGNKQTTSSRKPVFVTTVKTGIFLDPPPDLAVLLGLDDRGSSSGTAYAYDSDPTRYYSYSSKPRVLYDKQHQRVSRTDRQHDACCRQMQGYTNIMHDKRVVRGSNFAKKPYLGKESSVAREAEVRRRAMARKKAMDYQTRSLRLHLGAPKLTRGRQNVDIQTDSHLEELYECPPCQTSGAQTEFDQYRLSYSGTGTSEGTDASTQVDEKDLFDFDTEVTPIVEALITDVFRQAMREVLYEDELDARARQQRALCLRRTAEEIEKQRLVNEDERLNKVIADHAQLFDDGEKSKNARTFELTSGRVTDLLPEILNDLNQNEYTENTASSMMQSPEFVSWLMEELQTDETKPIESDETLKNVINELIKRRLDTYKEVTDVQSIEKPEELFKEIESITLQSDDTKNETDSR